MQKILIGLGVFFIAQLANAQSPSCSAAVNQAAGHCSQAISTVTNFGGPSSSPDSLGLAAAVMRSQAQLHLDGLNSAKSYCQDQIKSCQSQCAGDGSPNHHAPGPGAVMLTPDGQIGANICTEAQLNSHTDASGLTTMTPKKGSHCVVDPLVVQLTVAGQPPVALELGSIAQGVLFDILGLSQPPLLQVRTPISWFTAESRRDSYFLVLPDAWGQVVGVRQMFGNVSIGPDRRPASDGFAALAKYDEQGDGIIDQRDSVFSSLKLWSDLNGDGIAQAEELFTLGEKHVTAIDLHYDAGFAEADSYGNVIQYKSTVRTESGDLGLVYDIWFALNTEN